jgi:hypothetical protein
VIPAPPPGPPFAVSSEELKIVKPIDTGGTIHTKGGPSPVQIGLDTYAELDFVSISYVRGLKFTPCKHKNHHHTVPIVEGAGTSTVKTYGVFHLIIDLTHRWERTVSLTRPFVAIDRSIMDTPILLGRPILQDLAITIDNAAGNWEFKKTARVKFLSAKAFYTNLGPRA